MTKTTNTPATNTPGASTPAKADVEAGSSKRSRQSQDLAYLAREVTEAAERIRPYVRITPVERSPALKARAALSSSPSHVVLLKLENTQATGSFKLRGAFNKLLTLSPEERKLGVVAASTGNHGMAVASAAATLGCPALVFAPENAARSKIEIIRELGAEVRLTGSDGIVAERAARGHARAARLPYVSPYNDRAVVAGQGTLAVELLQQIGAALAPTDALTDAPEAEPRLERIYVALGGGGLLSGIGGYLRQASPHTEIVACSPERSAVLHHSLAAGRILELESEPTLSDGTAGGVESDSITFPLCQQLIARSLLVTEQQIVEALRLVVGRHHILIEGSAGVAVAGYLADPRPASGPVAIVLCGANIDAARLKEIL